MMQKLLIFIFAATVTTHGHALEDPPLLPMEYSSPSGGVYTYQVPDEMVIGMQQTYTVRGEESLHEIARFFGLGFNELADANPEIDPWIPPKGARLIIPTIWVLPRAKDEGIVINIAEMRLYYFFQSAGLRMVRTFPIGIGREGLPTPKGVFRITEKVIRPDWYPSRTARAEDASLQTVIPPGPENPLGGYWLQLSEPGYGIHGTNRPWGVGMKVSRGCIRLYPEDIVWLFEKVKRGTRVEIVDQPIKIGHQNNRLFVQIHKNGLEPSKLFAEAIAIFKQAGRPYKLDEAALQQAVLKGNGLTIPISG